MGQHLPWPPFLQQAWLPQLRTRADAWLQSINGGSLPGDDDKFVPQVDKIEELGPMNIKNEGVNAMEAWE